MNLFSICVKDTQLHIQPQPMFNSRQMTPKVSRQSSNSRRIIQSGDYFYDCPIGENQNCISGEVYIRKKAKNQLIFEGIYFNNQKNGFGIEYDQHGQVIYEGEYKNDMKDGWGYSPTYEGRWRQDQYDGWGRLMTHEIFYEGYFSQGNFNGFGILMKANEELQGLDKLKEQTKIDQYILNSLEKSPNKLFIDHNLEEIYLGQFTKGLKNGAGKLHKKNQEWYIGQFSYGMLHGNGTLHQKSEIKKGAFVKGKYSDQ